MEVYLYMEVLSLYGCLDKSPKKKKKRKSEYPTDCKRYSFVGRSAYDPWMQLQEI